MFCKNCGAELPDGSTFCSNCGANLSGEASGTEAGNAPAAASFEGFKQKIFAPALAKLLTVIFLFVAAGCALLVNVGNFANAFMPVVGDLITLVFIMVLYSAVAVLLLIGKTELAKKVLYPIFAYWLIDTILSYLAISGNIVAGANGLVIVYSLFEFAIALLLIAAAVLFILSKPEKRDFTKVAWILIFAVLILAALAMLLRIIRFIDIGVNWTRYFSVIGQCALTYGMVFAVPAVAAADKQEQ